MYLGEIATSYFFDKHVWRLEIGENAITFHVIVPDFNISIKLKIPTIFGQFYSWASTRISNKLCGNIIQIEPFDVLIYFK